MLRRWHDSRSTSTRRLIQSLLSRNNVLLLPLNRGNQRLTIMLTWGTTVNHVLPTNSNLTARRTGKFRCDTYLLHGAVDRSNWLCVATLSRVACLNRTTVEAFDIIIDLRILLLLRSVVNNFINLDSDFNQLLLIFFKLGGEERHVIFDSLDALLLFFDVVAFSLSALPWVVQPRVKRDVEIHLQQEGIRGLSITYHRTKKLFINFLFLDEASLLECDIVDPILRLELYNL